MEVTASISNLCVDTKRFSYLFQLAKPYESLYWAGAERSLSGVSWMEGAVSSGTEAARQITQDLPDAGDYFKNVKQTKKVSNFFFEDSRC